MKRADIEKIKQLDPEKLQVQEGERRKEIAQLIMQMRVKNLKNTNIIAQKRKELAIVLTIMRQKQS
ncbi:50S ribosomal protein L29 [Candidatus Roizmanbacteria bacterium RIFCSPLOWO2_01_FULL_42_14]|uniref:Large ribosomal subunit protein uL29 n=4 Tax=Candidatus Roizmaniibacteriota TaxID=1752723 RepID=A0A1F7JV00_9BACT|nr:MAG: 50S ribosomal protein L29 [Candidatus Roizmanbacteria bacterium RIFCSPHIGHO2_02_FULL_43_11]OGK38601.1 MAG: 50S ribosomal protein L29 [Candidatus Roizmanbacteria bacterium RIFCSPHIGHO2_12_FULL_42_10]OGK52194.1 MAG: 50S ribosomal protein L29 [Candidatus Roizmanbacteria bacterium RIFCSPLOWO2_01_FULL_42_14]OGK59427.1 MAG: 50S ribosomal protein L29 [Candidatus Roizmanbacteria bacterium RIFCSPLOWO2_02_FULL_43_10]